jgi:hypothetical protein
VCISTIGLLVLISAQTPYWQQDVRYGISVRLDAKEHLLFARETLSYRNNSPDTLSFVWIHLYPNAYRDRNTVFGQELERMGNYGFSFASARALGFIEVDSLTIAGRPAMLDVQETEMKVSLPEPLKPGDSTRLDFVFRVKIPAFFSRLGHQGRHYVISQWYPKMVVYDRKGWHPDGYHAIGEFYGEYGTFDVTITLPADLVVGGTGDMVAADSEVAWMALSPKKRLKPRTDSLKTLRFHAENVHDFAWVADPDFVLVRDSFQPKEPQMNTDEHRLGDSQSTIYNLQSATSAPLTVINVLVAKGHEKDWKEVPEYARKAMEHFSARYGPYPYSQLTVADARLAAGGGMEYPNLVVIASSGPSFTRLLEEVVVHEIGHQWFYGMLGSNEMDEAWLDEGFTTFATTRYFEETYGRTGNLTKWPKLLGFLPKLDDRYYQQLTYYLTATNGLLKPVLTPAPEFIDEPAAYAGVTYAEASCVVDMLRRQVGDSCFDQLMRTYFRRYYLRHPSTTDFIEVAEEATRREASGRALGRFFEQWLHGSGTCDYAVKGVARKPDGSEVTVERLGHIRMPVEIQATFADGTTQTRVGDEDSLGNHLSPSVFTCGFISHSRSRIRSVILDPERKLLESDRWNNYFPRRIRIEPIFDLPSYDAYQVFYGPYIWWSQHNGLEPGAWLMGRQFIDAGPLRGKHIWTLSGVYYTNLRTSELGGSYSTPLSGVSNDLRLGLGATYSPRVQTRFNAEFSYHQGRVFGPPSTDSKLAYQYWGIRDTGWLCQRDWHGGRVGKIEYSVRHQTRQRCLRHDAQLRLALADRALGSDSGFQRFSLETRESWRPLRNLRFNLRFFAGYAGGSPPPQEQFFLSGSLTPTDAEPITWSYQEDIAGTQQNWHIDGDADLRGFAGAHIRGKLAGSVSLGMPVGPVMPFFDLGNVGDSLSVFQPGQLRMDAGVRVRLGPLYADFPVWRYQPGVREPALDFRWLVGFSLSGISIGP